MSITDNNLLAKLNQIKQQQQNVNNALNEIKQDTDADLLPEIEEIERAGYGIIFEIDEIKKQINKSAAVTPFYRRSASVRDAIERNSILAKMPTSAANPNRRKIGSVFVD